MMTPIALSFLQKRTVYDPTTIIDTICIQMALLTLDSSTTKSPMMMDYSLSNPRDTEKVSSYNMEIEEEMSRTTTNIRDGKLVCAWIGETSPVPNMSVDSTNSVPTALGDRQHTAAAMKEGNLSIANGVTLVHPGMIEGSMMVLMGGTVPGRTEPMMDEPMEASDTNGPAKVNVSYNMNSSTNDILC